MSIKRRLDQRKKRPTIAFSYQGRWYTFRFKKGCDSGITILDDNIHVTSDTSIGEFGRSALYGGYTYDELLQKIKNSDRKRLRIVKKGEQ